MDDHRARPAQPGGGPAIKPSEQIIHETGPEPVPEQETARIADPHERIRQMNVKMAEHANELRKRDDQITKLEALTGSQSRQIHDLQRLLDRQFGVVENMSLGLSTLAQMSVIINNAGRE